MNGNLVDVRLFVRRLITFNACPVRNRYLVMCNKRIGRPSPPCSGCSTHTMNEELRSRRKIIIDDIVQKRNVYPSCCQISDDQQVGLFVAEFL